MLILKHFKATNNSYFSECYDRHYRCTEFKKGWLGWFNERCAENTPSDFVGGVLMREACPLSCGDKNECNGWKGRNWFQDWCKTCRTNDYFGGIRLGAACPNSCICDN